MPLISLSPNLAKDRPEQPVLVFADDNRSMGLMVDEIVDRITGANINGLCVATSPVSWGPIGVDT
jgi:hypothetical protein